MPVDPLILVSINCDVYYDELWTYISCRFMVGFWTKNFQTDKNKLTNLS